MGKMTSGATTALQARTQFLLDRSMMIGE